MGNSFKPAGQYIRFAWTELAEIELEIGDSPRILEIEIGRKLNPDMASELWLLYIEVKGAPDRGYQASFQDHFKNGAKSHQFLEVIFESFVFETPHEAYHAILTDALRYAEIEGYNLPTIDPARVMSMPDKLVPIRPTPEPEQTLTGAINQMFDIDLDEPNYDIYEIDTGYIGSLGRTFETATRGTFNEAVAAAAKRHDKTTSQVIEMIDSGKAVDWQDSPNFTYDHSKGFIRKKKGHKPVALVECSCGHSVPRALVMSASLGTSCSDCYDQMSN